MGMQTDVKSAHASAAGSLFAGRTRLKGFSVAPAASTAATFEFRDGGASGTILCQIDLPSNSNPNSFYTLVPGEGVRFYTNIYATLTGLASVTVYYG